LSYQTTLNIFRDLKRKTRAVTGNTHYETYSVMWRSAETDAEGQWTSSLSSPGFGVLVSGLKNCFSSVGL
jgi:hypothetical protein